MTHRFHRGTANIHNDGMVHFFTSDGGCLRKKGAFNGLVETRPERLSIPLKRRKPTVYAVWNDLFHEAVPFEFWVDAYKAMAFSAFHTFLVLTKRPRRMLEWYATCPCPLPNIYHGLTVCNQQEADEKIPIFLQVPGKKFLSLEPLLSDIDLHLCLECQVDPWECHEHLRVDAVILGGETGPGARPMHPDWVRSVRDQCAAAGVPFFFKQWGEWLPVGEMPTSEFRPIGKNDALSRFHLWGDFDKSVSMKIGRRAAGRLLDGRTHDDLPWRKP